MVPEVKQLVPKLNKESKRSNKESWNWISNPDVNRDSGLSQIDNQERERADLVPG